MTVHQRISNCRDPVKYSLARKSSADPVLWGPGHVIKMHTFDQIISDEKFLLSWLQGRAPESESQSHRCCGFNIQANVRAPMHQLAPMSHHHHQSIIDKDPSSLSDAAVIKDLVKHGLTVVKNVPCDREGLRTLQRSVGIAKKTHYGDYFQVRR